MYGHIHVIHLRSIYRYVYVFVYEILMNLYIHGNQICEHSRKKYKYTRSLTRLSMCGLGRGVVLGVSLLSP